MEIYGSKQCLYCTTSLLIIATVLVVWRMSSSEGTSSTHLEITADELTNPLTNEDNAKRVDNNENQLQQNHAQQPRGKRTKIPDIRDKPCGQTNSQHLAFYSQSNEDRAIYERFFLQHTFGPKLCHGTFVEIGALDGRLFSNTMFYERYLNWTGVLIEGNPELLDQLDKNRPDTVNVGMAVCPQGQNEVVFVVGRDGAVGGSLDHMGPKHWRAHFGDHDGTVMKVPCQPMGTILTNAGVQQVDFFSIDVEGAEIVVLETMDWTIPVHVIMVEVGHHEAKDQQVRNFLIQKGFKSTLPTWDIRAECSMGGDCAPNEVFYNPDYPSLPKQL